MLLKYIEIFFLLIKFSKLYPSRTFVIVVKFEQFFFKLHLIFSKKFNCPLNTLKKKKKDRELKLDEWTK